MEILQNFFQFLVLKLNKFVIKQAWALIEQVMERLWIENRTVFGISLENLISDLKGEIAKGCCDVLFENEPIVIFAIELDAWWHIDIICINNLLTQLKIIYLQIASQFSEDNVLLICYIHEAFFVP